MNKTTLFPGEEAVGKYGLQVDREALLEDFLTLVRLDSPPGGEGKVASWCQDRMEEMGLECRRDGAARILGGETGNLHGFLPGKGREGTLLLSAHMDTVPEAVGVKPVVERGCVRSDGTTPLGADDKSGIAVILQAIRLLLGAPVPRPDIHVLFTVQEETGLKGVRAAELGRPKPLGALVLDGGSVDRLIHKAPAKNYFQFRFLGREAHLTREPELGLNAVEMAAHAVASMPLGRIDALTTAGVSAIRSEGGEGKVPVLCEVEGQVSSLDRSRLEKVTHDLYTAAMESIRGKEVVLGGKVWKPGLEARVEPLHPALHVPADHPLVEAVKEAARSLGRGIQLYAASGGCDANILFARGVPALVLGTGMALPHTCQENIRIEDMVRAAQLLARIVQVL